ncbi:hypothetical protein K1719_028789 [Acacia pycnantha]|nr:hypothetical protein K1719_028789 [Acacia pycnantha]
MEASSIVSGEDKYLQATILFESVVKLVTFGFNSFRYGKEYIYNFDYRPLGVTEFYEIQIGCPQTCSWKVGSEIS